MIVEVSNKVEADTLITEINKVENVTSREPTRKLPKIVIDKNELLETLLHQTPALQELFGNLQLFQKDIRYKFSWGKANDICNHVLEVSPKLRKVLLKLGKINIEWSRCSVEEYFGIMQCFKCCKYGC